MSGVTINVQVIDTLTPVLEKIRARALRLDAPNGPLPAIGELMVASVTKTFEAEGRPDHWKPLALATLFGRAGVSFVGGKVAGGGKAFKAGFLEPVGEKESGTFRRISQGAVLSVGSLTAGARKRMESAKILRRTGRLMRSINSEVTGGAVVWGTDETKYAALHQFGGRAGRNKKVTIPARPFITDPFPEDWKAIEEILLEYLALSEGSA